MVHNNVLWIPIDRGYGLQQLLLSCQRPISQRRQRQQEAVHNAIAVQCQGECPGCVRMPTSQVCPCKVGLPEHSLGEAALGEVLPRQVLA